MNENTQWLQWAMELQSLGQAGEAYANNAFDEERYTRIREIAAEMAAWGSELPLSKVKRLFTIERGYQTPKLSTRMALVKEERILLVQEVDGFWTLPGGWADVGLTLKENTVKETLEESGLVVRPLRLIALLDRSRNNEGLSPYSIQIAFVLGELISGSFIPNAETLDSGFFSLDALPPLAEQKTTRAQIAMCLEAAKAEHWETVFD